MITDWNAVVYLARTTTDEGGDRPAEPVAPERARWTGRFAWAGKRRSRFAAVSILALLVVVVFGRAVGFDFVNYDDPVFVIENPNVQSGLSLASLRWAFSINGKSQYHPLTWISYMVDWQLFGSTAGGYHLVNILLHLGSSILLLLLLERLTGSVWRSATVAILWAVHPLRVESVAWVAERKDVLSVFLALLCLIAYARYGEKPRRKRYLLVIVIFLMALLAKPMVVTLPFVMLLLDYWPLRRAAAVREGAESADRDRSRSWGALVREKLPLLVLALGSGVLTILDQQEAGAMKSTALYPIAGRVINALTGYGWYLTKLLWPTDLACFYPIESQAALTVITTSAALLAVFSVAAAFFVRRWPFLLVGWFWYVVTLLPVAGLIQVGDQRVADRYSYLPHIGLLIAVVWLVGEAVAEVRPVLRRFGAGALVAVAASMSWLSWVQVGYWQDSVALLTHALQVTRNNYIAHNNLALALLERGDIRTAVFHLEQAVHILPRWALPHLSLGKVLDDCGRTQEALGHYLRCLESRPDLTGAEVLAGSACLRLGRFDEAVAHLTRAFERDPGDARAAALLRAARDHRAQARPPG